MPSCLIIASHFPPFQSAGVFRTIRIAKYLPDFDWELDVLSLDPQSYLSGASISPELLTQIPDHVRIHRTIAKHPNQWIQNASGWVRQFKNGVKPSNSVTNRSEKVIRNNSVNTGTQPRALLQRAKDAITLPWMTPDRWIGWLPFAICSGKRLLRKRAVDVLYSSGPPWTNHMVAERLKRGFSIPWVADFRDPWVGNNFRPQRRGNTWVGRRHQILEQRVIELANIVIFNTTRAREEALGRYPGISKDKFHVIPNGFDPEDFAEIPKNRSSLQLDLPLEPNHTKGNKKTLRLVHTGAFYGMRNIDALLHSVGDLLEERRLTSQDLCIDLIGGAKPNRTREQEIVAARGISDMVNVLPRLPHHECIQQLSQADVLLLVQTSAPLCVPGKLYEYMAVGKPILTLAASGSTADIVFNENLGACIDPKDTEKLKNTLCDLIRQHQTGTLPVPSDEVAERYNGRIQMHLFDKALRVAIHSQTVRSTMSVRP